MIQMIHFHCPACGTTLQLPSSLGGQQGPCPRCYQDILAPNPTFGLGPRLAPQTIPLPPPPQQEHFQPFSDSPSAAPRTQRFPLEKTEPVVEEMPPAPAIRSHAPASPIPTCKGSRRTILFLSCALTALLGLGIGYLLGLSKAQNHSLLPTPTTVKPSQPVVKTVIPPPDKVQAATLQTKEIVPTPPVEKRAASPLPVPAPIIESPKKAEPTPVKVSDQAMATLKAFLDAPDWASRSAYVLHADKIRPAMEAYSHQGNDGPTSYTDIQVANSATDSITGETLFIFQVDTTDMPNGIPVAVQETSKGWLVDWPTFVEFRDDRFEKFATGKEDGTGIFHLIVRTPPEGEDQAKNQFFATYLVTPPLPDRQRPAFCKKDTAVIQQLQRTTPAGNLSNLVLEVAKKTAPDGNKTPYLEIINVVATNWRPSPP